MTETFVRRVRLPVPAAEAFAWHARPGAFARLSPPWERVEVERGEGLYEGARVDLRLGPARLRWRLVHRDFEPGRGFRDVQVSGPFASWDHHHRFEPDGDDACVLEDRIEYALPGGAAGRAVAGGVARRALDALFDYRHAVTAADLAAHVGAGGGARRFLVTGASGMMGTALVPMLTTGGHDVVRAVRHAPRASDETEWHPERGLATPAALEGLDGVVHLAGENLNAGRWTAARKRRIRASRVEATRRLCEDLAALRRPPTAFVAASAMGWYGDAGDTVVDEDRPPAHGFLPEVVRDWEGAAEPMRRAGARVVALRFGLVLSPRGGALASLLRPFRFGLGGPLAGGRAWWSWIAIDDVVGLLHAALTSPKLSGPINAVAPEPVRNAEFTRVLGRTLRRPAFVPVPALALRVLFGEMADQAILPSVRASSRRAIDAGYRFRFARLGDALAHLLGVGRPHS